MALAILMLSFFVADLITGSADISPVKVLSILFGQEEESIHSYIIFRLRLPRALAALFIGAGLSVSGVLMQSLFRNPLAGPYVLGVSSGASLMVALMVMLGGTGLSFLLFSGFGLALTAIVGALAVMFLVLFIAIRVHDSVSLLIIGIMIAGLTSSIVGIIQYFTSPELLQNYIVWTFGSLTAVEIGDLYFLIPVVSIGLIWSLSIQKSLNILLLGDNNAQLLGVNLKRIRYAIILITGLVAGVITAFAGPIAFIGVAVPHLVRNLFKTNNHFVVISGSIFTGASLLLACDIISQLPGTNIALPINSVTSLIGAPIIIWIIVKNKRLYASNF